MGTHGDAGRNGRLSGRRRRSPAGALLRELNVPGGEADGLLAEYCRDLFSELPRSDQRAWAEVYVRGLLTVPGRKTPARISEHIVGKPAVAQLQQFVNQSPWDHLQVLGRFAGACAASLPVRAWALDTVAFPKTGKCSVGVSRQYSAADGKVLNCQLGMAASLVGDGCAVPVDWQLMLPAEWDQDAKRRTCAHVPSQARHLPGWQYGLQLVDELLVDWALSPRPVLVDWRRFPDEGLDDLLRGFEERGLGYLVRIDSSTGIRSAVGRPPGGRLSTAYDLGRQAQGRTKHTTVAWREGDPPRLRQTQFLSCLASESSGGPRSLRQPRWLLMEWPAGRDRPRNYWFTNLDTRQPAGVVGLAKLGGSSRSALGQMLRTAGLQDFEGRSFRGWHHHVTLASVAFGFGLLAMARADEGY
jgi:hypothetical protein